MTAILTRYDTTSPETEIALDMARRSLLVAPVLVLVSAAVWGVDGALSAGYGVVLVLVNFAVSAALLVGAGRISLGMVMGAALFGYLLRLGLIAAAVLLVKDQGWVELVPLGLTLVICHLGLLLWETRYVSASLAFPGLAPPAPEREATKE